MALGKKRLCATKSSSTSNRNLVGNKGLGLGLEFVKRKRSYGKKRVLNSGDKALEKSLELEALHQDLLVKIICGVEHEDLKQLFNVSKTIREATLIAKMSFEYKTPRKTLFFRGGLDSMIYLGDEIKAPLLKKCRLSRITCEKKVSKISMALFK